MLFASISRLTANGTVFTVEAFWTNDLSLTVLSLVALNNNFLLNLMK